MDVTPYVEGMKQRMAEREAWEREAKARAHEVARRVAEALARLPGVTRVFLYGSMAYHPIHKGSDIDIAVEGASQAELDAIAEAHEADSPFRLDIRAFEDFQPAFKKIITDFGELLYDRSRVAPGSEGGDRGGSPRPGRD